MFIEVPLFSETSTTLKNSWLGAWLIQIWKSLYLFYFIAWKFRGMKISRSSSTNHEIKMHQKIRFFGKKNNKKYPN